MAVGYLSNRSFCQELVMRLLSCRGLLVELAVILLGAEIAFAQTVDQPGLVAQYDQSVTVHNATIDSLIDLAQKSADPEFRKIIARGSDAIAAGTESLGSARVNVQAAGTTAAIYAQALRDGRIADARAAASLWSKQATLARDHLQAWGQSLSMAQAAIEAAKRWLAQ